MGSSNPCGDLDQMWLVGRYGGITCAIFGDCRLRGVGVVKGPQVDGRRQTYPSERVSLPSPIDLTRHTTM